MTSPTSDRIRELNDALRTSGRADLGTWVITDGVLALGQDFVSTAIGRVRGFETFTPDNDPHREHDFGAFEIDNQRLFWKIDYYDRALEFGSENPADPEVTSRVLTLLLASEY